LKSRSRGWSTAAIVAGLFLGLALIGGANPEPLPACSDGQDNDGDGNIDADDPNCQVFVDFGVAPEPDIYQYCPNWDDESTTPPLSECN